MIKLTDLMSVSQLAREIADGFVKAQRHPRLPLRILNYSHKTQYAGHWNDVTEQCRGLVVDDNDYIVARPFRKFWNRDERDVDLPSHEPEILEKLDGCLGILVEYEGEQLVATRGSFTSAQAIWATDWLARRKRKGMRLNPPPGHTAIFEIISPVSRIVVPYSFEGLILLSLVDRETGVEPAYSTIVKHAEDWAITPCRRYQVIEEDVDNFEGYVLTWRHDDKPPTRVKVKLAEYVRLHRLLTNSNPKRLWQAVYSGADLSPLFDQTPEDFQRWVRQWLGTIWKGYDEDVRKIQQLADYVRRFDSQKTRALWLTDNAREYANLVHSYLACVGSEDGRMRRCNPFDNERQGWEIAVLRRHEPRGDEPFMREE